MPLTAIALDDRAAIAFAPDGKLWAITQAGDSGRLRLLRAGIEDDAFVPVKLPGVRKLCWSKRVPLLVAAGDGVVAGMGADHVLVLRNGAPQLVQIEGQEGQSIAILGNAVFVTSSEGALFRIDSSGVSRLRIEAHMLARSGERLYIPAKDEIIVFDGKQVERRVHAPGLFAAPSVFHVASDGTAVSLSTGMVSIFQSRGGLRAAVDTKEGRYASLCISSNNRIVVGKYRSHGAYYDFDGKQTGRIVRPFSNPARELVAGPDGLVAERHAEYSGCAGVYWHRVPSPRKPRPS